MQHPYKLLSYYALLSTVTLPALALSPPAEAYTPVSVTCPSEPLIRSAGTTSQTLGAAEAAYVSERESTVIPNAWLSYFGNVESYAAANELQLPSYVQQLLTGPKTPDNMRVGMAVSGGGYRAALVGGGIMNAFDGRNTTSKQAGTGGLLQGLSYLSGLSGGGWLVSSLTQTGWPTVPDLVWGKWSQNTNLDTNTYGGFLAQLDFIDPSSSDAENTEYFVEVVSETEGKRAVGFDTTMTDWWARVLARHMVNGTSVENFYRYNYKHGAGILWSQAPQTGPFSKFMQPFPILIADSISPFENKSWVLPDSFGVPISNPIYELNPYEFGSYDPMLSSFIPMQYLGSSGDTCFTNFDQTSYVQAVSSNVFNGAMTDVFDKIIQQLGKLFPKAGTGLLSAHIPNAFQGVNPSGYIDTNTPILSLGDGGEDGQEIPFQPLLVKARGVDIIVGIDLSSGSADNYPTGGSLIDTGIRAELFSDSYSFPPVPSTTEQFSSLGLTKQPSFFGCDNAGDAPLVIYIPSFAPLGEPAVTNTSTWQFTYEAPQMQSMMDQAFDIATQGIPDGNQKDKEWPVCVACAVVDRARANLNIARSGACQSCMSRYCWQPSSD